MSGRREGDELKYNNKILISNDNKQRVNNL